MPLQCTSGCSASSSGADRRLGKDHDVVDAAQRGDELRAMLGGQNRPALPLQRLHRGIVVDRDDEQVGLLRGGLEIAHVADVQQVEAAVGERDRAAGRARRRDAVDERVAREDLTHAALRRLRPR